MQGGGERKREREREQIIMALRLKMYVASVCYLLFLNDFLLFVTEICYYCCTFSNTQTETNKENKKKILLHALLPCVKCGFCFGLVLCGKSEVCCLWNRVFAV